MKRRNLALMIAGGVGMASAGLGFPKRAKAALTAADADRLKSELTPLGALRAGNAAGTIPAWTGDNIALPGSAPFGILPDFFAGDAKLFSINSGNLTQYQDSLSDGVVAMIQKYPDFRLDVYPTHRTAIATPEVYANAASNVLSAQPVSGGSRLGFTNAYGAPPFPIPDANDPAEAGAQVMWNHNCRWQGVYVTRTVADYVVVNGQLTLTSGDADHYSYPFYYPGGNAQSFNGYGTLYRAEVRDPSVDAGQGYITWFPTNPLAQPSQVWEYLSGEGRVRRAPELNYDTPTSGTFNLSNYDEYFAFNGALDKYDWKLLGKKEVFVPYNNNKLFLATPEEGMQPHFYNPDLVRWELHRVWVIDAVLHPGERNVLAHRVFYVDEDSWTVLLSHAYDGQGNLFKLGMTFMENRPEIPATREGGSAIFNMQTGDYASTNQTWNVSPFNGPFDTSVIPPNVFNSESMAAVSQY
jgi:hypothetical protein